MFHLDQPYRQPQAHQPNLSWSRRLCEWPNGPLSVHSVAGTACVLYLVRMVLRQVADWRRREDGRVWIRSIETAELCKLLCIAKVPEHEQKPLEKRLWRWSVQASYILPIGIKGSRSRLTTTLEDPKRSSWIQVWWYTSTTAFFSQMHWLPVDLE